MSTEKTVDLLIIGSGTAATNAARSALAAGAHDVHIVHTPTLINTCVEEGCMPSKSILAGGHANEPLATIESTRNVHITRLRKALTDSFAEADFSITEGIASFVSDHEVTVTNQQETMQYQAEKIIIATGSEPFVPPIPGVDTNQERILLSDDVVSERAHFPTTPTSMLVVGAGPIGLELATFFHDIGTKVTVLNRTDTLLPAMDPEFGQERLRASQDQHGFPIHLSANLLQVLPHDTGLTCTIGTTDSTTAHEFDYLLIATGRKPRLTELNLAATGVAFDDRGNIVHDATMRTSVPHIYVAGDVTGHHQILHFAAEMGKTAGTNAVTDGERVMDYDRHLLAVSFDQFPSAFIGLTETEATKRGIAVVTATKHFNSIGLGILKRQKYGLWKVVADAETGRILGAQVLGPSVAGELVQLLVPIIHNQNTAADIMAMTWYHPTYAEILYSLARDICKQVGISCPGL